MNEQLLTTAFGLNMFDDSRINFIEKFFELVLLKQTCADRDGSTEIDMFVITKERKSENRNETQKFLNGLPRGT